MDFSAISFGLTELIVVVSVAGVIIGNKYMLTGTKAAAADEKKERQDAVRKVHARIDRKEERWQACMNQIKTDISEMKADQASMKATLEHILEDISAMKKGG